MTTPTTSNTHSPERAAAEKRALAERRDAERRDAAERAAAEKKARAERKDAERRAAAERKAEAERSAQEQRKADADRKESDRRAAAEAKAETDRSAEAERRAAAQRKAEEDAIEEALRKKEAAAAERAAAPLQDGLDPAQMQAVIQKNRSVLDACVQRALTDPATASYAGRKVYLMMLVGPNGKADAALEDADLDGSAFGACIRRAISKMPFPAFRGDAVGARIPIQIGRAE